MNHPIRRFTALLATLAGALPVAHGAETYRLGALDLRITQEWGEAHTDQSVEGHPLQLGGHTFANGVGTHANSRVRLELGGTGERFSAQVGVDDEVGTNHQGSVVFTVAGDRRVLWTSGVLHGGDAPKSVKVDLHGVKVLTLTVEDAGDGISYDHADWADAEITMSSGRPVQKPLVSGPPIGVLTPPAPPTPAIHSPKVFGVRPGAPFLYTVAATGERPLRFTADGLPAGLSLDPATGRITGILPKAGEFSVQLHARNNHGEATRPLKIVCGPEIGLTPALGWNSWNCFAGAVTAEKVKAAADALVRSGLADHGWTYINIDDFWEVNPGQKDDPTLQGPARDAAGRIVPNPRFPDLKGLADYVHGLGLKIGIYSSPGPSTCGGCIGSWEHEELDARQYGDWGIDYLKYDWCSYSDVAPKGLSHRATAQLPYRVMRAALDKVPRDILFSFCQYGDENVWEWGAETGGNSWRTTGDISDSWSSLAEIGFTQAGHEKYAGPGHFNDPDMLIVGQVGWGPQLHPTHLTQDEQYTHLSLWCLLASPLLIGCDLTQMDDFTKNLLTNDEVLAIDQDPLGRQAARISKDGPLEVWAKELEDGSRAVGLFNRDDDVAEIAVNWAELHIAGRPMVRDVWRQQYLGTFDREFRTKVRPHGVVLLQVQPARR